MWGDYMIKVLQIGMSYETGGTEVFLYNHYKEINKEEIQFDFIAYKDTMSFEEEVKALGANVYRVIGPRKNPFLSYKQLLEIIKQNNYDVIHINISSFANILPVLTAIQGKVPKIIVHSHNNGMEVSKLKIVLHHINKFVTKKLKIQRLACSKSAGQFMFGNAPFEVFDNAIDPKEFAYNSEMRKEKREELGIPEDSFVIGNVGRLHSQKNQKFLIEVFNKYLKINPNAYLLIVGQGELEEELKTQAEQLGIKNRVIMPGFKSNVKDYYNTMDIFCLPSIYEGLGIVGIEAQMNGLPCIYSDKCVEEVDISKKSLFLPLDSQNDWLRAIEYTRRTNNEHTRYNQPDEFNLEKNVKKLELIYKSK